MKTLVRGIDRLSNVCGALAAIIVVVLIVLMLYDVMMRYLFNAPTLWGFDVNTFLMGASFVLSIAYALANDAHVRVDLLYTPATRWRLPWVDLVGFSFLMLPTSAWITTALWHYFAEAYRTGERSGTSAWNPVLWPFRFILFVGFLVLTLQILAEILKRIQVIRGDPIGGPADSAHDNI
jgi:TRAP-type mannitol/chloroaromatic compound transport system permease small subunit